MHDKYVLKKNLCDTVLALKKACVCQKQWWTYAYHRDTQFTQRNQNIHIKQAYVMFYICKIMQLSWPTGHEGKIHSERAWDKPQTDIVSQRTLYLYQ